MLCARVEGGCPSTCWLVHSTSSLSFWIIAGFWCRGISMTMICTSAEPRGGRSRAPLIRGLQYFLDLCNSERAFVSLVNVVVIAVDTLPERLDTVLHASPKMVVPSRPHRCAPKSDFAGFPPSLSLLQGRQGPTTTCWMRRMRQVSRCLHCRNSVAYRSGQQS